MLTNIKNTLSSRIVVISILGLAMLIPLGMVQGIVSERGYYYQSVISEIANLWGAEQTLTGPVLVIPFVEKRVSEEQIENAYGKKETKSRVHRVRKHAIFLPNALHIDSAIAEQYRSRGIYDSLVYEAKLALNASFDTPQFEELSSHIETIEWNNAEIVVGLSDTKSIDEIAQITWQENRLRVTAGTGINQTIGNGFRAKVGAFKAAGDSNEFQLQLALKGSRGFRFTPVGEITRATISSPWPHPKFAGNLLPDAHEIKTDGFNAQWQVPHIARNYPQSWVLEDQQMMLSDLVAGVDLFEPVFIYSKIQRAVKYGLLFVGLTFITFLAFEMSTTSSLHYVQYLLIGVALAMFYLLLLSLSEHIEFIFAYIISAAACIAMISLYATRALNNRRQGKILFALLSGVFALLYALLQMEDYALLVGTWVLFVAVGGLMYLTRGIGDSTKTGASTA